MTREEVKRNSGFELMRILSMYMVVLGHCVIATAENQKPYLGTIDNIGWFINAFTIVAVNSFFLLTGFYAKTSQNCKKLAFIWLKMIFYSAVIYVILACLEGDFEFKNALGYFMPVVTKKYWYMQTYVVLALVAPFLTRMLEQLSKREYEFLLLFLVVFFSIHETFIPVKYTLDTTQGYGISWAIVMFIFGKWLNLFGSAHIKRISGVIFLLLYFIISVLIYISNVVIVKYGIAGGLESRGNFYAYNSITVFASSVCFFCFFMRVGERIGHCSLINSISKNSLSVYLISGHPILIFALWTQYIRMKVFTRDPQMYVLLSFVFAIVVFAICVLIDKLLDKVIFKNKKCIVAKFLG